jgi:nitrile hydratase
MPRTHDRGGRPDAGPIDRSEHELAMWEKHTHAMMNELVSSAQIFNLDEFRRAIEDMEPEKYEALTYYERWTVAIENLLVQKGVLTREEIDRKVEENALNV